MSNSERNSLACMLRSSDTNSIFRNIIRTTNSLVYLGTRSFLTTGKIWPHLSNRERLIDGILATLHQSSSTVISSQVSSVSQNVGQMLAGMGKLRTDLDVSQITSMVLMLILISLQELSQYEHIMWLPRVEYAVFNEYRKDAPPPAHCCKDRRENTLDQIEKWREGYDEHCIFWLSRMAGTGKSTIARTVANMFYQKNRLGANFLFSRGKGVEPRPTTSFPFFPLAWRQ